mgnify:CR=1 FL=1
MELSDFALGGRKLYSIVLILGMVASVITFNMDMELLAAGIITAAVISLALIKGKSNQPIFDERDVNLAEESTHKAVMLSGAFLGVVMIVISIGMGLGRWSYPEWLAPYYLTWVIIIGLTVIIESLKKHEVIE